MAKALLSSSLLPSLPRAVAGGARLAPLPPLSRSGCRRAVGCRVRASLHGLDSVGGLHAALERAEAALYTLADAAVVAGAGGAGAGGGDVEQAVQKSGGWFGFISDAMEVVLKVERPGCKHYSSSILRYCH
jgi:YidC/Oxa1 family membrane protein insertase